MTIKEIIDGLKFTVAMFLFDPDTGETYVEPRNDMDKTTIDACKGAIELLEQTRWIPVSERLPEDEQKILFSTKTGRVHNGKYHDDDSVNQWYSHMDKCRAWNNVVTAWMPLPKPYQSEIRTGSEGSNKVNCDKTECCNCVNHGCCDYEAESEE